MSRIEEECIEFCDRCDVDYVEIYEEMEKEIRSKTDIFDNERYACFGLEATVISAIYDELEKRGFRE